MLLAYIIICTIFYIMLLRQEMKDTGCLLVEDFLIFFGVAFVPIINLIALFLLLDHIGFLQKKLFVKKGK